MFSGENYPDAVKFIQVTADDAAQQSVPAAVRGNHD
jgi:hypothetical protein